MDDPTTLHGLLLQGARRQQEADVGTIFSGLGIDQDAVADHQKLLATSVQGDGSQGCGLREAGREW